LVEKQNQPVFWDISDRTALAQADIIDKEVEGEMYFFDFAIQGNANNLEIMTTRPELLPACVAVMINGQDERYQNLILKPLNQEGEGETGSFALTPIFGVKVPIIADNSVQIDKGTGVVMCCTFGDETDVEWWEKYNLPLRAIIGESGILGGGVISKPYDIFEGNINESNCLNLNNFVEVFERIVAGNTLKKTRELIINELSEILSKSSVFNSPVEGESKSPSDFGGGSEKNFAHSNPQNQTPVLIKSQKIIRPVKCAERSGVPIEFLIRPQWYIKIRDKKDKLKQKSRECNWYPEYMRVRIEQWIDGLSRDWCISRQRFFGVKFPVWYSKRKGEEGKILIASLKQLPCDPFIDLPEGYTRDEVSPETDIMDTWATSSISPQLSSKGISDEIYFDKERHEKLFPADMRPQAHEIIRTWAFYTITKAYLHSLNRVKNVDGTFAKNVDGSIKLQENINDKISLPWKNLMISGWCLASDKTKMSKSKGNVVTPTALIQEKSADVVRYWASASNLGADIAYSEDVFKIGQKLITKLFNSAKFCSQHFAVLEEYFSEPAIKNSPKNHDEKLSQLITETTDIWILLRLKNVIENYQKQFAIFEYARAREVVEEFFWKDFCDNYLEICKVRSYGLSAEKLAGVELETSQQQQIIAKQLSSIATLSLCLKNILKLLAPFIPHITEEIYATIFADEFAQKQSIHARGNFAKLPENLTIINQENIEKIGEELLAIIFEVRKFKSEKNLSMKVPIAILEIASKIDLSSVSADLLNVTNSQKIEFIIKDFSVEKIIL
jgi:valyl-tRNA synthetase